MVGKGFHSQRFTQRKRSSSKGTMGTPTVVASQVSKGKRG